jgi:hypothetical protein
MADPITITLALKIFGNAAKTINKLYHLRSDLKNGSELLEDIKATVDDLKAIIETLRSHSQNRILSQENFDNLANSHTVCDQRFSEVHYKLSIYCRQRGGRDRLFDSLRFRFGPREELMNQMAALEKRVESLLALYKL